MKRYEMHTEWDDGETYVEAHEEDDGGLVYFFDVRALCRRVVGEFAGWGDPCVDEIKRSVLSLLREEGIEIGEEAANGDEGEG